MKFSTGLIHLSLSALIVNGCAFSKDDKSKKDQNPVVIQQGPQAKETGDSVTSADLESLRMEPREELHAYDVIVKWKENKKAKIILEGLGQKFSLEGTQHSSATFICKKAEEFTIHARTFSYGSDSPNEFDIKSKCPTDIELIGNAFNQFPETNYKFGRLVLHDRTTLNLDGKNLDLEVKQLLVEGTAEIRSYQSNDIDKENVDMNKAPIISIKAEKAGPFGNSQAGQIEFHLIGLNGKPGRSGDELEKENSEFQKKRKLNRAGENGTDSKISARITLGGFDTIPIPPIPSFCKTQAGPGKDGLPGEDGLSGEDGQHGMNTPKLILKIEESKDFVVNILQIPGIGGAGGKGGSAILGGAGGAPGKINPSSCASLPAKPGNKGTDGKPGSDGQPGKTGAITPPDLSPNIRHFIR